MILGYTVANDVTARDLQRADGQWTRAKGYDTFCPLGPWIETDAGPGRSAVRTELDGDRACRTAAPPTWSSPCGELVEYVSAVMTLLPGDVILTGTPAGVGPMTPGRPSSVTVEGIGTLTNPVAVARPRESTGAGRFGVAP